MATVAELVESLANRLGEPVATVRQKVRRLQDEGLLPLASGRLVPAITARHAALAIFAVATAGSIKVASGNANRYAQLKPPIGHLPRHFPITPGHEDETLTALAFLTKALSSLGSSADGVGYTNANAVYDFCISWPELFVRAPIFGGDDDAVNTLHLRFVETGVSASHWQEPVKKTFSIGGIALAYIAYDLGFTSGEAGEIVG